MNCLQLSKLLRKPTMVYKKSKSPKVSANTSGPGNVVKHSFTMVTFYHIPADFSIGGDEKCQN